MRFRGKIRRKRERKFKKGTRKFCKQGMKDGRRSRKKEGVLLLR